MDKGILLSYPRMCRTLYGQNRGAGANRIPKRLVSVCRFGACFGRTLQGPPDTFGFFRERYRKTDNAKTPCSPVEIRCCTIWIKAFTVLSSNVPNPVRSKNRGAGANRIPKRLVSVCRFGACFRAGLSRVSRHIRFFRERYRKPKWHIDYFDGGRMKSPFQEFICAKNRRASGVHSRKKTSEEHARQISTARTVFCASQLFLPKRRAGD